MGRKLLKLELGSTGNGKKYKHCWTTARNFGVCWLSPAFRLRGPLSCFSFNIHLLTVTQILSDSRREDENIHTYIKGDTEDIERARALDAETPSLLGHGGRSTSLVTSRPLSALLCTENSRRCHQRCPSWIVTRYWAVQSHHCIYTFGVWRMSIDFINLHPIPHPTSAASPAPSPTKSSMSFSRVCRLGIPQSLQLRFLLGM